MEYIATYPHKNILYHVYRNSEGFLELYRRYDDKEKDIDRIVTNITDPEKLGAYLNPPKKKRKKYNPHKDLNQLKIE